MSMRGGYQIIDLKNIPLYSGFLPEYGENHITIKGIYYNLYHSNAKMILLSGLNMDNKPHRDYEIIPYEEENEFKAILKKVWNTDKHMVYTYFLHIANDDDVYITYEELDYDRVDKEFNEESDIAIANSTVTKKVKSLEAEDKTFVKLDGSRPMTGDLNINSNNLYRAKLLQCVLAGNLEANRYTIGEAVLSNARVKNILHCDSIGIISEPTLKNAKLNNSFDANFIRIQNVGLPSNDNDAARYGDVLILHDQLHDTASSQNTDDKHNSFNYILKNGIMESTILIATSATSFSKDAYITDSAMINKFKNNFLACGADFSTDVLEFNSSFVYLTSNAGKYEPAVANVTVTLSSDEVSGSEALHEVISVLPVSDSKPMASVYQYTTTAIGVIDS